MRRLFLQIYVGFLAVAFLCLASMAIVATLTWGGEPPFRHQDLEQVIALVGKDLPPDGDPALDERVGQLSRELDADITLGPPHGPPTARRGLPIPLERPGLLRDHHRHGLVVRLNDGRHMGIARTGAGGPGQRFLTTLLVIALATAAGCWPLAQRITRRLQRLEASVTAWGEGDFTARVEVQGKDEVAAVAQRFNEAADKVQAVMAAQRRMLASASHELRTPLTRIRMALELLGEPGDHDALLREAKRDVVELDATVGDLLEVGRMQALMAPQQLRQVDLLALLAEEAVRVGADVSGPSLTVQGNPRLLRRLVRNLLVNAVRHGAPPVAAWTTTTGLVIADRGPGVPTDQTEQIFEPFHRPAQHDEGSDGGVGLGLFLVREIARYHDGDVRYQPRQGGGSCFEVTLPVAAAPSTSTQA